MAYTVTRKTQDRKGYVRPRMLSAVDLNYVKKVEPPKPKPAPLPSDVAMADDPDIVIEKEAGLPSIDEILTGAGALLKKGKGFFNRR